MRYWGKNVVIDGSYYDTPLAKQRGVLPGEGDVERYEKTVQDLMRHLEHKSAIGRVVIQAVNRSPRQLRIIPLTLAERFSPTSSGSSPTPVNESAAYADRTTTCYGGVRCVTGTGDGSDVVLNYEPYSWQLRTPDDPGHDRQPDDVLLHELVHCLRLMRGKFRPEFIGPPFCTTEELFAILIANMYVHRLGRLTSLRGDYAVPFHRLPGQWTHSAVQFYHDHKKSIDRLCCEMPDVCNPFGLLDGFWNPFRVRFNERLVNKS
jgi:hypothetical protein